MIKINGCVVGNECFPNNERIFKIQEFNTNDFVIDFKYETDVDISVLIMCKKYLDDIFHNPKVTLVMKYVPYSRMDRDIQGYMFSLKYFCQLINDLNFYKIIVLDTHSNITIALLDKCEEMSIQHNINKIFTNVNIDYVFYPDAGAMKRYNKILKLPINIAYFYGNKKRDLQTGRIINYELVDCPDIQNKNILIVDDLCAFGGTFALAAEKLIEKGAKKVYLYISHCENSIHKGKLINSGLISKVFTTDSILSDWKSNLIVNIEE